MTPVIRAITFLGDGVSVEYATAADIRDNGLALGHMLFIPNGERYADALDNALSVIRDLVERALADFTTLPPVAPDDDDDELGPYDNPNDGPLPSPPGQD